MPLTQSRTVPPDTLERLTAALSELAENAPPKLAELAGWLAERPEQIAFHSVRTLAEQADSNAGAVVRLAGALGFRGYEPLRQAVRDMLRAGSAGYAARAARLTEVDGRVLSDELHTATRSNLDALFTPELDHKIAECADAILSARSVHCLGVRSCYSVAHYLAYVGSMAFPQFRPMAAQPGGMIDAMSECTAEDMVFAITYADYSAELIHACEIARAGGARLVVLADSDSAPIAEGAWQVIRMPMDGPQLLPSLVSALQVVELLLAELSARDPETEARVRAFEQRLLRAGGYVRVDDDEALAAMAGLR